MPPHYFVRSAESAVYIESGSESSLVSSFGHRKVSVYDSFVCTGKAVVLAIGLVHRNLDTVHFSAYLTVVLSAGLLTGNESF